ncbi:hypothetical protein SLS62_010480 [Diatrype stigma]|uniref:Uncharacterized protein n=1 Tax=Diatrype stigma TaxID=117547 RepID=A0AAN9YI53_9PEZI
MDGADFDEGSLFPGLMMADSEISELDLAPEKKSRAATAAAAVSTRNSSSRNSATISARHADHSNINIQKPRRMASNRIPKESLSNPESSRKHHQKQQQQQQQEHLEDPLPPSDLQFLMPAAPADDKINSNNNRIDFDHEFDSWEEDIYNVVGRDPTAIDNDNAYYTPSSPPPSYRSSNRQQHRSYYQQQQQQQQHLSTAMTTEERLAQIGRLCVAVSGRLVTVARENRHLAVEAGARLDAYVLRPCLRAGAGLARTYCPEGMRALRDAEAQVRRAVMGGDGGGGARRSRGVRKVGGSGGELLALGLPGLGLGLRNDKGELLRLKDRLVEQDALLRDWHAYTRRLMRERDGLRRRLSGVTTANGGGGGGGGDHTTTTTTTTHQQRQLAEQLRELQMLVDQLALHGPHNNHFPRKLTTDNTQEVLNTDADHNNDGDNDDGRYDYYYDADTKDDANHDDNAERDRKKAPQLGMKGGLGDDDNNGNDDEEEDWTLL